MRNDVWHHIVGDVSLGGFNVGTAISSVLAAHGVAITMVDTKGAI